MINLNHIFNEHLKTKTKHEAFKLTVKEASSVLMRMEEWEKPVLKRAISDFFEKHNPRTESVTSGVCSTPSYSIAV